VEVNYRDATEQLSQLKSVAERVAEVQWENEQLNNQVAHLAAELEKKRDEVEDHQHHIEEQNDKIELMETRMRKFKLTSDQEVSPCDLSLIRVCSMVLNITCCCCCLCVHISNNQPAPVQLPSTPSTPRRNGAPPSPRSGGGSEGRSRPRTLADELRALGTSSRRLSLTQSPQITPTASNRIGQPPSPMSVVVTSPTPLLATLNLSTTSTSASSSSSTTTTAPSVGVAVKVATVPSVTKRPSFAALDAAAAAQAAAFAASNTSPIKLISSVSAKVVSPPPTSTMTVSIAPIASTTAVASSSSNPLRRASDAVSVVVSPTVSPTSSSSNGGDPGSPIAVSISMTTVAVQQSLAAVASIISHHPHPPLTTNTVTQQQPASSPHTQASSSLPISSPAASDTGSTPVTTPSPLPAGSPSTLGNDHVAPIAINAPVVPGTPGGRPTMLLSPGPALSPAAQKVLLLPTERVITLCEIYVWLYGLNEL
jgi:hypothetical protein